jgi:hypothetical protein
MKNYSIIILLAVLAGLAVTLVRNTSRYNQQVSQLSTELAQNKYQFSKTQNMFMEHLQIEKNDISIDSLQLLLSPLQQKNDQQLVIFRIFQENCRECITKVYDALKSNQNLVIVTNYDNERELKSLIKDLHINKPVLVMKHLYNGESSINPYLFAFNHNRVSNIFIPNEDLPDLTKNYLKNVYKNDSEF